VKQFLPGLAAFAGALLLAAVAAQAQSCATIGASTYCGARGSHNTVGNTMIFNTGPAGQRLGSFTVTGTPPRTSVFQGAQPGSQALPRTFAGVGTPRRFGSGEAYDSSIARLRAQLLALEAQYRLEQLTLTPAQEAAKASLPPALVRALTLAKQAREKAAMEGGKTAPVN
jgi:hypothetical protein